MAALRLTADLGAIASALKGLANADIRLEQNDDGQSLTLEVSIRRPPVTARADLPLTDLKGQSVSALSLPLRISVEFTEGDGQFSKFLGLLRCMRIKTCEVRNGSLTIELDMVE